MKAICFISITSLLFSLPAFGQVIIGEKNDIDDGVILQIDSDTKGALFPVVSLTNRNMPTPLTGTVPTGTFIFNTNTFGSFPYEVTPGFFWWDNDNRQWNPIASSRENFTAKYANTNSGRPTDASAYDYYDRSAKNMKIFGNIIFNENYEALERINDSSVKFNYFGLYAISVVLSLNKYSDAPAIALKVNLALDNKQVGASHYIRSSSAVSTQTGRYFANSFTEFVEVNEGQVLTIKAVRATLQNPTTYRVNFDLAGSSSITITRIR
jgi:hypothetical protein